MHRTFVTRLIASGWPQDIASLLACGVFFYGMTRLAEISASAMAALP